MQLATRLCWWSVSLPMLTASHLRHDIAGAGAGLFERLHPRVPLLPQSSHLPYTLGKFARTSGQALVLSAMASAHMSTKFTSGMPATGPPVTLESGPVPPPPQQQQQDSVYMSIESLTDHTGAIDRRNAQPQWCLLDAATHRALLRKSTEPSMGRKYCARRLVCPHTR